MAHALNNRPLPRSRPVRGSRVSTQALRTVWAAVTAQPTASCDELARSTGYRSKSYISEVLRQLRAYGYIAFDDKAVNARRVLVPFVVATVQRRLP